jgi:hypothetical protein
MNGGTKIGLVSGAAAIAAFVAILQQGDTRSMGPRVPVAQVAVLEQARLVRPPPPQLVEAMFGRAIVEFIGLGFGLGLLAFGLSRVAAYRSESRRASLKGRLTSSRAAKPIVLVTCPRRRRDGVGIRRCEAPFVRAGDLAHRSAEVPAASWP